MKPHIILIIFVFALCAFSSRAAGDLAAEFNAANKLYAEGKFADAAAAYEKTIQEAKAGESASAALYFNDGNAEFKLNHLGKAIAAYRHAALLTPRDAEIPGNLEFVRNQVQGATVRPSRWQTMVGSLTLNEGACLTAAAFWLTMGLFTLKQVRPALAPKLQGLTLLAVGVTVMFGLILAAQAASHFSFRTAVVTESNAIARSGPFDDAQTTFPVHDGAELSILDQHDDWLQVADGSGKIGWLSRKQLALLPGA